MLNNIGVYDSQEIIQLIQKRDSRALKMLFDKYYSKLFSMALRYSKNEPQADLVFNNGMAACYSALMQNRNLKNLDIDVFVENEFIKATIDYLKNIRNEYYVSSTVHAVSTETSTLNLFDSGNWTDINLASPEIMFLSLQQLVPSQRLIFNLHIIEGKSLNDAAMLVESSVETAKSNLEKARFHLQKNIEKNLNR